MSVYGISGIYKISAPNLRYYVGQSSNVGKRWSQHLDDFRANKHTNPILQASYNKYGESALEFTVLVELPTDELDELEQLVLDECIDNPLCMNIERVVGKPRLNRKHTEETKAKCGATNLGRKLTYEHKAKISAGHLGQTPKNILSLHKSRLTPIIGVHTDGTEMIWESLKETAKYFGCSRQCIGDLVKSQRIAKWGRKQGWQLKYSMK